MNRNPLGQQEGNLRLTIRDFLSMEQCLFSAVKSLPHLPSLPNLSQVLLIPSCPSPNLVVSQGTSLTGPDLWSIHR